MSLSLGALFGERSYPEKFVYYLDEEITTDALGDALGQTGQMDPVRRKKTVVRVRCTSTLECTKS